jgi:hypothetical protein
MHVDIPGQIADAIVRQCAQNEPADHRVQREMKLRRLDAQQNYSPPIGRWVKSLQREALAGGEGL